MIEPVNEMPKKRLQVTLRPDLVEWMEQQQQKGIYASYSHAIERALIKLKEETEGGEIGSQ